MEKLVRSGRIMFAAGLLGLGFLCFVYNDFIIGRPPAFAQGVSLNIILLYIVAVIFVLTVSALLFLKGWGWQSCLVIAFLMLCFSVYRHILHFNFGLPNGYKALALMGGSLVVGSTYRSRNQAVTKFNNIATLVGKILLAAFFIVGGYSHFRFADFVKDFIPEYIPFRSFWGYFCGICLIAGGIGIHIPRLQKPAAVLSGIMLSCWFIFLHIPRFISNPANVSDRLGLFESLAFAGIFFCLTFSIAKEENELRHFKAQRPL
ncbi:MAG TPA: hypothetical protein VGD17_05430 [Chitinophagaceae bacterium]